MMARQLFHVVLCDEWAEVWSRGHMICKRALISDALEVAMDLLAIGTGLGLEGAVS